MPATIKTHSATLHPDQLVDTATAARRLGVSASFLYKDQQQENPRVPFVRIVNIARYRVGDLQAFIIQNTHGQRGNTNQ
jgi:hypothetical protein